MVSDSELVGRLWDILRDADLETATAASVRRRLEEQLGVCLLDRKAFIRDQIDLFLQTHVITPQNDKVQRGADDSENVKQEKNENRDSQKEGTVKEEEQEEIDDQDEKEEEEADEKSTQKAKYSFFSLLFILHYSFFLPCNAVIFTVPLEIAYFFIRPEIIITTRKPQLFFLCVFVML